MSDHRVTEVIVAPSRVHKMFREIAKAAVAQGWQITVGRSGHLKWRNPAGFTVFSSSSPSDYRAVRKHITVMRKYGYEQP